ncbi:MAG: nuclear transport factor 2 family protein, partial [Thermoanaerobaculia bacterium]
YRDHHLKLELEGMKVVDQSRSNLRVVSGDDMALATFEFRIKGTYKGRTFDANGMETVVLRRSGGVWRIIHVHESSMPKKLPKRGANP